MDPNATFVLAGGLGGIGRATARWMAERGATNLILLSRSGPRADVAHELIHDLRTKGVRVEAPACDITDLDAMKEVFGRLSSSMPPIKGVVQMSIVARVSRHITFSFNPSYTCGMLTFYAGPPLLRAPLPRLETRR